MYVKLLGSDNSEEETVMLKEGQGPCQLTRRASGIALLPNLLVARASALGQALLLKIAGALRTWV